MSATLKKLTGAALAAVMTLGGLTSAYAQNEEQPFYDDTVIEEVQTDAGQPMSEKLKEGLWIYEHDEMTSGHEWVGVAGFLEIAGRGSVHFWDIYHKKKWVDFQRHRWGLHYRQTLAYAGHVE